LHALAKKYLTALLLLLALSIQVLPIKQPGALLFLATKLMKMPLIRPIMAKAMPQKSIFQSTPLFLSTTVLTHPFFLPG